LALRFEKSLRDFDGLTALELGKQYHANPITDLFENREPQVQQGGWYHYYCMGLRAILAD
jgi:hypothetical protein